MDDGDRGGRPDLRLDWTDRAWTNRIPVETRLAASQAADRFRFRIDAEEGIPRLDSAEQSARRGPVFAVASEQILSYPKKATRNEANTEERYHHDN